MSTRTRKIAVIAAISLFAIFATQAVMFVHLLCEGHHHERNSHECPICQQLLTLPHSVTIEQPVTIAKPPVYQRSITFHVEVKPEIPIFSVSGPRAPPICL